MLLERIGREQSGQLRQTQREVRSGERDRGGREQGTDSRERERERERKRERERERERLGQRQKFLFKYLVRETN